MTIFTDAALAHENGDEGGDRPDRKRPRRRRRGRGWIVFGVVALVLIAITISSFVPSRSAIEKPGPVFDTLGTTTVDKKTVPLIDIPSETTYPTDGTLDMLTVSVDGTRESPASLLDLAVAWFTPSQAILPLDELYPQGETQQQSDEEGAEEMADSQQQAVAAALTQLGLSYTTTITVDSVAAGSPAAAVFKKGDVITAIGGQPVADVTAVRAAVQANGTSKPITVTVTRGRSTRELSLTPTLSTSAETGKPVPVLGVVLLTSFTFPFDVKIQLENVGGPSAGQMFALGIYDKLTPGSLTGGKHWAGTGEIDSTGAVSAIGGIRQKMYGARDAGATYFLAPKSNCDEVVGHIPKGLTVFATTTLKQSITEVQTVASGGDTAKLPRCSTG